MPKLNQKTSFVRDQLANDDEKNSQLADLLEGQWSDLAIVRIERIEIGDSGWFVTYRE